MEPEASVRITQLRTPDEFFPNPEPSDLIADIQRNRDETEDEIRRTLQREGEDWSFLGGKVVGAEHDGPLVFDR